MDGIQSLLGQLATLAMRPEANRQTLETVKAVTRVCQVALTAVAADAPRQLEELQAALRRLTEAREQLEGRVQ